MKIYNCIVLNFLSRRARALLGNFFYAVWGQSMLVQISYNTISLETVKVSFSKRSAVNETW